MGPFRASVISATVLFEMRFRDGVQDGSVTVTFRRWKRCQAIAGHRYRTAVGMIEVEAVDVVGRVEDHRTPTLAAAGTRRPMP